MGVRRLLIVLLLGLLPLAGWRALWWSELLFARPWGAAGGGEADYGRYAGLLTGGYAAALTLVLGLILALILDALLTGRGLALPILMLLSLIAAALLTLLLPGLALAAFWILWGFWLTALVWLYACLTIWKAKRP